MVGEHPVTLDQSPGDPKNGKPLRVAWRVEHRRDPVRPFELAKPSVRDTPKIPVLQAFRKIKIRKSPPLSECGGEIFENPTLSSSCKLVRAKGLCPAYLPN